MKIVIANDHAGYELKNFLLNSDLAKEYEFFDLGAHEEHKVDYPDYAKLLCKKIADQEFKFGILICNTGIGMSIAANRNNKIRAALCFNKDLAVASRKHNDANVLVIGASYISKNNAIDMIRSFLNTDFDGGRHSIRISKLECIN